MRVPTEIPGIYDENTNEKGRPEAAEKELGN
jgi:hypothetical protein